jgi:hypothetical protein
VPLAEKGSTTHADYTCRLWDRVSALVSEVGRVRGAADFRVYT